MEVLGPSNNEIMRKESERNGKAMGACQGMKLEVQHVARIPPSNLSRVHHAAHLHLVCSLDSRSPGYRPYPATQSVCTTGTDTVCHSLLSQGVYDPAHLSPLCALGNNSNLTLTPCRTDFILRVWPRYALSLTFLNFSLPTCNMGMITVPTSKEGCLLKEVSTGPRIWCLIHIINYYYYKVLNKFIHSFIHPSIHSFIHTFIYQTSTDHPPGVRYWF